MRTKRRSFIQKVTAATAFAGLGTSYSNGNETSASEGYGTIKKLHRNKIGVSTYSFWQFNGPKENSPIEYCIERAVFTWEEQG